MVRDTVLESFRQRWEHVDTMTRLFVEAVPESRWESAPFPGFAPFCKQLRHVTCVRGVYNEGLRSRSIDFGRKHEHYKGGLDRRSLMKALAEKHEELLALLSGIPDDLERPQIDFFGSRVSYVDYLWGYVQHESIHHGQWSLYAAHGGYQTPELWRVQWGLGAGSV